MFSAAFYDEANGAAVVPSSVVWHLHRGDGTAVTEDESVTPAQSVSIVLSGALTTLDYPGDDGRRALAVIAVYDSELGDDFTSTQSFEFEIVPLAAVPDLDADDTQMARLWRQLKAAVPPQNGLPTSLQYRQAILDAVADFGRRHPRRLTTTFTIVAGEDTYELPAGFQRVLHFELSSGGAVGYGTDGYLVAFSPALDETYEIVGDEIVLSPTPNYNMNRRMIYNAGYPYDEDTQAFTGLLEEYEGLVSLKAGALASRQLGNASAGGFSYSIGDLRVDKSSAISNYAAQASELERQYVEGVKALTGGAVGRMAFLDRFTEAGWDNRI